MNVKLNTKTRQFSTNVVSLLILMVAVLVLGASATQAQTSTTTTDVAPVVNSSITIATKGTVNDPSGAFNVGGNVIVTAKRILDNTSVGSPIVVLDLDFSGLKGTSSTLKTVTYITGGNHAEEMRPLQATDTIIVTCPYWDSTKDDLTARTMLVTATLNFDVSTGKLTSGSITIGNNVVTAQAVGTTSM